MAQPIGRLVIINIKILRMRNNVLNLKLQRLSYHKIYEKYTYVFYKNSEIERARALMPFLKKRIDPAGLTIPGICNANEGQYYGTWVIT